MTAAEPVVLITGAAGGLGRGLIEAFVRTGWRVAAGFHTQPVTTTDPDRVLPVSLDVTRPGDPECAVRAVLERWGQLDALINNAGATADALLVHLAAADWERVLEVNLTGAWRCARAAAAALGAGGGHIVNIGSFAGRAGARGQAAYAAAKAGLIGLTQSLAAELAEFNVRVNVVLPGVLPTPMSDRLSAEARERLVAANRLRRMNSVAEVARFVVFLCSLENVSGQVFQLDSRPARWI